MKTLHWLRDWGNMAGLVAGALSMCQSQASSFTYAERDLLLGMRQTGGSSELVVNLGQASGFYAATPGATLLLTNLTTDLLQAAFPDLNGVNWSVVGVVKSSGDANYPPQSQWVTSPRTDLGTQTTPWVRQSMFALGNSATRINSIGKNAALFGSTAPTGPANTATALVEPSGDRLSYSVFMGAGDLNLTFQGIVENTTPSDFVTAALSARSDLYEIIPGSGATIDTPAKYLGYFELRSNGAMTFTAAGGTTPLDSPKITSITRVDNLTTVSVQTEAGANYTLLAASAADLGTKIASWSVIGAPTAGNGGVVSLTDSSSDAARFYAVRASR